MNEQGQERPSIAKTFYQLNFYLKTLDLPFTIKDLYREAYQEETEDIEQKDLLKFIDDDSKYVDSLAEPFTTHTIIETLLRSGHDRLVKTLMKRVRDHGIGFMHAYVMGISRWK